MKNKTQLAIDVIDRKQLAEITGISRATITRWHQAGALTNEAFIPDLVTLAREAGLEVTVADLQRDMFQARGGKREANTTD